MTQMYNRISVSIENWCENKSNVDGFLEISSSYTLTSVWWFQKDADIRAVWEEGRRRKKSHLLCSSVCDVNERVMRLWTESVIGSTYRVYIIHKASSSIWELQIVRSENNRRPNELCACTKVLCVWTPWANRWKIKLFSISNSFVLFPLSEFTIDFDVKIKKSNQKRIIWKLTNFNALISLKLSFFPSEYECYDFKYIILLKYETVINEKWMASNFAARGYQKHTHRPKPDEAQRTAQLWCVSYIE